MNPESIVSWPNAVKATGTARRISASLATMLIAVLFLFPAVVGTWFFLHPVFQAGTGPTFVWVEAVDLEELPDDGVAHKFVGAPVYLTRSPGTDRVTALSALDPHCGCEVRYDEPSKTFRDPCHGGVFDAAGTRLPHSVSPRDMDPLDLELRGGALWVKYQEFQLATEERIALPLDGMRE